jgi:subtilase family serine protease
MMKSKIVILVVILFLFSPICNVYSAVLPAPNLIDVSLQPLPGYVLQGKAPSDLVVLVNIAIPLKNADLLGSTLKQVSDPSSPSFRHFLTPAQIEQKFLPTTEYTSMLTFLQNAGMQVVMNSLDSMMVVQATVAQVNKYLHADVNMYTNGTNQYYMTSGNSLLNGAHFVASNATALIVKPHFANLSSTQPNANITYTQGGFSAKDLPTVYNATSLYAQGFQGEGQIIGILGFYGSPTINEDLALFDKKYGFPDPTLTLIPIVPYNPNLGASNGWSTEVALDVEMSHAMAPKAAIDLYITTGAVSFAADLAPIIDYNRVTTLSMSFSFAPEWIYPLIGGELFYFNMILPDLYFMIGSLQGITFLCSSGDAGGSGYSSGPAGNSAYPSDSPYVTSVGGTQTYLYTQPNGSKTFVQTGWSNPGYVPNGVNAGGSGGGVSFLEPKPWYQQNQQTPPSYPNGRMEPDLALQAGLDPGIFIVDAGSTLTVGGTSASVQLLSGLLTLIAQSSGGSLGLVNPFLYSLGNNASLFTKAFQPITFGYNIPWTASLGYNLVTGWGAPNIGEIAHLYNAQLSQPSLSVYVELTDINGDSPIEFTSNQTINVTAYIYNGFNPITTGTFTAELTTLTGTFLETPLTFDNVNGVWIGTLTMGEQSGVAYINVNGTSMGLFGEGFAQIFAGYLATFYSPSPTNPWVTTPDGLQVIVASTDLEGNSAQVDSLSMQVNSYNILNNQFTPIDIVNLELTDIEGLANVTAANLTTPYPAGPLTLMLQGSTYGFLPFTNGIYLQNSLIFPEVAVSPGIIAPGQYLTIITSPIAPINIAEIFSVDSGTTVGSDITSGSSVTAYLVNSVGSAIARSNLVYQSSIIGGLLQVPTNAPSGLYTILLRASYGSLTLGYTVYGSFYSKIWVSNGTILPTITLSPSTLYMGQTAQISADIRYPNGQEVTQGEYTAIIYPQEQQNQFTEIMFDKYLNNQLTPLTYNPTQNRWLANITLPSPYNSGASSPINGISFNYAGPYEAYVTGVSYDGVPTTTALSAQQSFLIHPYVYVANQTITSFQQNWGLALSQVTIIGSTNLTNDIFLGSNYLQSGITEISNSVIDGTLFVTGSNLTLQGVHGGNIIAINSTLNLFNTDLSSVALQNSRIILTSSSYQTITPTPPTILISSPINGASYKGDLNASLTVLGSNVNSVTVYLNGQSIQTFSHNGTLTFTLPSANYPDGTYLIQAVATQTTGITSTANLTIYFINQASSAQTGLDSLNSTQSSLQNQVNGLGTSINNLNSGQSSLQNQINNLGTNLGDSLNSLNSSQSTLQNQLGGLGSNLNSLNTSQAALQNQIGGLGDSLNSLNSTQSALQNQLGGLGDNLNASLNMLQNQIGSLKESLNMAQYLAYAGIGIGIAGVAVAVAVVLKRRSKTAKPSTT